MRAEQKMHTSCRGKTCDYVNIQGHPAVIVDAHLDWRPHAVAAQRFAPRLAMFPKFLSELEVTDGASRDLDGLPIRFTP